MSENTQTVTFASLFPIRVEPTQGSLTHFLLTTPQPQGTPGCRDQRPRQGPGRTMASGGSDISARSVSASLLFSLAVPLL